MQTTNPYNYDSIDLVRQHAPSLIATCNKLQEISPDVIIALSRKGPRILEVLKNTGLLKLISPVLTEKALGALPAGSLNNKKVVVFDDIIISGTTIAELVTKIANQHDADISVIAIAVDQETIKLEYSSELNYNIQVKNGTVKSFRVLASLPLSPDTRFSFCDSVVRSFLILNKPYDVDFPIFYVKASELELIKLCSCRKEHKVYSVATSRATSMGFERLTIIPNHCRSQILKLGSLAPAACSFYFKEKNATASSILKTRIYWDSSQNNLTIVPMFTFPLNRNSKEPFFIDKLGFLNDLIGVVLKYTNSEEECILLQYRLYCYLVNILWGYITLSELYTCGFNWLVFDINKLINKSDIISIFGHLLADDIVSLISLKKDDIIKAIRWAASLDDKEQIGNNIISITDNTHLFDAKRKSLIETIKDRVLSFSNQEDYLARKLSSIFQGMFYEIELGSQKRMEKSGLKISEAKRLQIGFNSNQLFSIVTDICGYPVTKNINKEINLAYDYLVDLGVMIPLFYLTDDGFFERVYRYGEDALVLLKSVCFFATLLFELDKLLKRTYDGFDGIFPQVTLEKIGVIIYEEMMRNGNLDALSSDSRFGENINFDTKYSRHGKVMNIHEPGHVAEQFVPWCERHRIIETKPLKGVSVKESIFYDLSTETGDFPAPVDRSLVHKYSKIGWFAYVIDRKIDSKRTNNLLVSITTCRTHREYLRAIREELRIIFESPKYSLEQCFNIFDKPCAIWPERIILNAKKMAISAYRAALDIPRKEFLWRNFSDYISAIDNFVADEFSAYEENDYKAEFRPYLSFLEEKRITQDISDMSYALRIQLESLGKLCIAYMPIVNILLKILDKACRVRIKYGANDKTKKPEREYIYVSDYNSLSNYIIKVNIGIRAYNEQLDFIQKQHLPAFHKANLMPINCIIDDEIPKEAPLGSYNSKLLLFLDGQINSLNKSLRSEYRKLKTIYETGFADKHWEVAMNSDILSEAIKISIDLAKKCLPEDKDKPRPKVGAVIIKDGEIISTAYRGENTEKGAHAEFIAINKAKNKGISLNGATIVTTLEPCTQRSPTSEACADYILKNGLSQVIIGQLDPNPEIIGKGVLYLQQNGVSVEMFPSDSAKIFAEVNAEFCEYYFKRYKKDMMSMYGSDSPKASQPDKTTDQFIKRLEMNRFCMDYLNLEDLKTLCIHTGIPYGELAGDKVSSKAAQLVYEISQIGHDAWDRLDKSIMVLYKSKWDKFKREMSALA